MNFRCLTYVGLMFLTVLLSACQDRETRSPLFHASDNPQDLSEWQILDIRNGELVLADGLIPYDLNTALFTDYAHKLRTVWIPEGQVVQYNPDGSLDFPFGTIISKTFYYPLSERGDGVVQQSPDQTAQRLKVGFKLSDVRLMETRLLVHRKDGWVALPYVWNREQTDAQLRRVGDIVPLTIEGKNGQTRDFAYVIPNSNQCAGCHATNATTRAVQPVGPKARHLNRSFEYAGGAKNQLSHWRDVGLLVGFDTPETAPKNARWKDPTESLARRARSYLDINCSHCHNMVGPADTSGLLLEPETPTGPNLGICKLPIAAGTGTGDRKFGIVPGAPEQSIFTFRMASTNPAVMMPELGRSLAHVEGVELIEAWIAAMEGGCP